MTSCGCFECIVVLIPEANGVMVVNREDPSMTPCGMTFSTLAGMAGGGMQTPGMMGIGKFYLTSQQVHLRRRRLQAASSGCAATSRRACAGDLKEVCEREGVPDLLDKIADETHRPPRVEELLPFLEEKGHPALTMDPIF